METQMAGSIGRMDGSTSQDAVFKDMLAYKEVLAHIMKTCVPEYKGLYHSGDHRLYRARPRGGPGGRPPG